MYIYIYFVEDFFSLCHLHFSHWICWCCFFTSSMLPVFFVRSRIYFNIKLTLHQLPISMHEISTLRMCVHVRLLFWTRTKRIIYDACTTKLMADYFIVYIWFSTGKKWKQNILIYRFFFCYVILIFSIALTVWIARRMGKHKQATQTHRIKITYTCILSNRKPGFEWENWFHRS